MAKQKPKISVKDINEKINNGKNPEIVISTPEITDVYSGRSKPKTSTSCLLK